MKRIDIVKLFMRGYAISFLAVGLTFLWSPDGTIRFLNNLGDRVGMFADAPMTGAMLWLSLAVAYMAVVTVLAWQVQADPAKNRSALVALTVGKGVSSLTSFVFYFGSAKVFLYLANGIVDGGITLSCLLCLFWLKGGKKG